MSSLLETAHIVRQPRINASPIKVVQHALVIDNVHTEALMQFFADRILLFLTQLNKPGTINECKIESALNFELQTMLQQQQPQEQSADTYSITTLFGKRSNSAAASASSIEIEQVLGHKICNAIKPKKPLFFMCALERNFEKEILVKSDKGKQYLQALEQLIVDAVKANH